MGGLSPNPGPFSRAKGAAPSGLEIMGAFKPGALPRAIVSRPFRAAKTQHLARRHEQQRAALMALTKSLRHQAFTGHCEMETHTPRPDL